MLIEIVADFFAGQRPRPEGLGIVSGEFRFLEVAGNMQDKHEFAF